MTLLRLFTAVAILAAPAGAAEFSVERLDEAVGICQSGENHDGQKVDGVLDACHEALELLFLANKMGLCHDDKRGTWRTCQFTDD